jgi:K+-transporting ATPase ATPase A chain
MTWQGWLQAGIFAVVIVALVRPVGDYMAHVMQSGWKPLRPFERLLFRAAGVDEAAEQSWVAYAMALLVFHAGGMLLLYALQRVQTLLPLNPQGFDAVAPDLALNTALSHPLILTPQQNLGKTPFPSTPLRISPSAA